MFQSPPVADRPRMVVRSAAVLLVYVVAIALFCRSALVSGFDLGFGERGDAIIEIAILEHWRNVLAGVAAWDTSFYFHPYHATLGYNDGYLLYGLVYSGWRLIADPFHADTLNILTFKTIGFAAAYALVARSLGWGQRTGLAVALLWTVASNITLQAVHAQLQSVALQPVAMMLAIATVRAEQAGRLTRARFAAMGLALLLAAWLLTSYYMAWFTLFSACLYCACWAVVTRTWRPGDWIALLRRHAGTILAGVATFAVAILPFLRLYLPKVRETGGEAVDDMLGYLVTPVIDMINVGPGNIVWGWLFLPLFALVHRLLPDDPALPGRVLGGEHEAGFPLLFCALALLAAWRIVATRRIDGCRPAPATLRAFALAMIVAWLLTIQLWKASPWLLVFHLVPGAKGLRTISRYQLWLTLPLLLIAAAVWRQRARRLFRRRPWLAAGLAALLVAENLSAETPAQLSRAEQRAALMHISPPPPGCASFYVVATRPTEPLYISRELHARYPHNVDAMLLAELWRVPTINGFSTFNPPDWDFAEPRAADYDARVRRYAQRHRLRGLCRLDVRARPPWSRVTP